VKAQELVWQKIMGYNNKCSSGELSNAFFDYQDAQLSFNIMQTELDLKCEVSQNLLRN